MTTNISETKLKGVIVVELKSYEDSRGFFMELYHEKRYRDLGILSRFVQDNLSYSIRHTLRGLHYQIRKTQAKLVQALTGEIFDVALDVRKNSPTFGQWAAAVLSAENRRQMFIPEGFAHGFCVLSDEARVLYKCSDLYSPQDETGILWSDPDLGIDWPVEDPIVSAKDRQYLPLAQQPPEKLLHLEDTD